MTNILKIWWKDNRWWMQLLSLALTAAVAVGVFMQTVYAYGPRIDTLEQRLANQESRLSRIEQGVDDIKFFWHIPNRKGL